MGGGAGSVRKMREYLGISFGGCFLPRPQFFVFCPANTK